MAGQQSQAVGKKRSQKRKAEAARLRVLLAGLRAEEASFTMSLRLT